MKTFIKLQKFEATLYDDAYTMTDIWFDAERIKQIESKILTFSLFYFFSISMLKTKSFVSCNSRIGTFIRRVNSKLRKRFLLLYLISSGRVIFTFEFVFSLYN